MDVAVAICTTPRTGGNLLDDLLLDRGYGFSAEWFHPDSIMEGSERWGVHPNDYLAAVWENMTSDDGVFAVRLHWHQLDQTYLAADWDGLFPPGVPVQWLLLTRDDLDAQARSFLSASRSGDWRAMRPHADDLNEAQVRVVAARFARQNRDWLRWLDRDSRPYLRVRYETLIGDPDGTADRVASWLSHARVAA